MKSRLRGTFSQEKCARACTPKILCNMMCTTSAIPDPVHPEVMMNGRSTMDILMLAMSVLEHCRNICFKTFSSTESAADAANGDAEAAARQAAERLAGGPSSPWLC
eukprot:3290004-Lingulodinium_polyedra.AAC.1